MAWYSRNVPWDMREFLPIHKAAYSGDNAEISRLVSSGADVDADINAGNQCINAGNQWPSFIAFARGHASTVLLLLDLGADPNKLLRRLLKETQYRSYYTDEDYVKILKKVKERGAYIHPDYYGKDFRDCKFDSGRGSEELMEFYLNEGVNPDPGTSIFLLKSRRMVGVSYLTKHLNNPPILKLLRSYGADATDVLKTYKNPTLENMFQLPGQGRDRNGDWQQFRVIDGEATYKALTEPVEQKYPGFWGCSSNDPRVPSLNAKIERLESQLLACGQSLETCKSEKASMRSQLYGLEDEIAAVSARLTQARTESRNKDLTIDRLERVKVDLEQSIDVLRVAVDEGLLTTNRLKAEIEQLKEDIRILGGAARSAGEREERDPPPTSGYECRTPYNRDTATMRQRIDSCVPVEGGVFDNVRTATGGRYTNRQMCIEDCYIP